MAHRLRLCALQAAADSEPEGARGTENRDLSPRVPDSPAGEGHYSDTTSVEDRESPGEHSAGGFAMLEVGAFSWNGTWPLRVAGGLGRDCSASEAHQPLSRHLPEGEIFTVAMHS